eukprot:TRINITY_DN14468_c0_g1_i1.p1 TRINITY_DN14468_c0_g1~~TRINITY_DN14468_c0_g1_i1.p1  ORF type:complete len:1349 (-),score=386.82 TRINITY_DN14468_c0_g1_i1:106-3765(-)
MVGRTAVDRVVGVLGGSVDYGGASPSAALSAASPTALHGGSPPSPMAALTSPQMGDAALLQRRLTAEAATREACQLALAKIRRVVSFFRQQVQAATATTAAVDPTAQHLRELAEALDEEVRTAAATASTGAGASAAAAFDVALPSPTDAIRGVNGSGVRSPGPRSPRASGSYEVLRQSLQESQRRCEGLNGELMKQAQVNDQLVGSLKEAKDTKKRLAEQVRQQSEEIAVLQRRRLADEERLEEYRKKHKLEEDLHERDAQRRLAEAQRIAANDAESRLQDLRRNHSVRVESLRAGLSRLQRDCAMLKAEQGDQRRAAASFSEAIRQLMQHSERSIMQRLEVSIKGQFDLQVSTSDAVRELEVRVASEHQLRVDEVASWSHRHALLIAERDDLQARVTREVGQLVAQLQAAETGREEDRRAWADERNRLARRGDDLAAQKVTAEAAVERLKLGLSEKHAALATCEQEHRGGQAALEDCRRQVQQRDDALASSELEQCSLREQMEAQRRRLTEAQDRAVITCRELADQRLAQAVDRHHDELQRQCERTRLVESQVQMLEGALDRSRTEAAGTADDAAQRRRELQRSNLELEELCEARRTLQDEVADMRRCLSEERTCLRALSDRSEQRRAADEREAAALQAKLAEAARTHAEREERYAQRLGALEAGVADRDHRVEDRERCLVESREATAKVAAEAASERQQVLDLQLALEKAKTERLLLEEDRCRLEETAASRTRAATDAREQYERWREDRETSLLQAQDESASALRGLSDEKETFRSEIAGQRLELAEMRARLDGSEQDLSRVRYLLTESQNSAATARQDREKSDREASSSRAHLEGEMRKVSAALENSLRTERTLAQTLAEATERHREEQKKLLGDLEQARRSCDRSSIDHEQQLERLRVDCETRVQKLETRHGSEVERERSRMEGVLRENEQLRRFLTEARRSSAQGSESLQSQLENHITRLQQHTSELRGDLSRSGIGLDSSLAAPRSALGSPARGATSSTLGGTLAGGGGGLGSALELPGGLSNLVASLGSGYAAGGGGAGGPLPGASMQGAQAFGGPASALNSSMLGSPIVGGALGNSALGASALGLSALGNGALATNGPGSYGANALSAGSLGGGTQAAGLLGGTFDTFGAGGGGSTLGTSSLSFGAGRLGSAAVPAADLGAKAAAAAPTYTPARLSMSATSFQDPVLAPQTPGALGLGSGFSTVGTQSRGA